MGNKNHLTLYIDNELVTLAKASNMNLSNEFEEWIKIRLNQNNNIESQSDPEKEIIRYQAEIQKLKTQAEKNKEIQDNQQMQNIIIDNMINNMKEYNDDLINISDQRTHGLVFLFKKKLNLNINPLQAKELLLNRIKELDNA